MDFFIRKNATLPILKLAVIKDGRSDYNEFMDLIETSALFFSMVDIETGVPKISTRPAGFVEKVNLDPNAEVEYYIYYQFTNRDTNRVGRYEGQFLLRTDSGNLILPIQEKLFINIQDSFISDELPYESCYVSEFPCCVSGPSNTTTTTTACPPCPTCPEPTPTPITTTTTTSPTPVTTTTTIYTPCDICLSGVTLPLIGQTKTYNGITLSGGGSGFVTNFTVSAVPACYPNWSSPLLNSVVLGTLSATYSAPFSYTINFSEYVNNVVFRLINYSGYLSLYKETFTITLSKDGIDVPLTITPCEYCCGVISGNTILSIGEPDCQNGSGIFEFSTEISYNQITITGPGGGSGTILDLCEYSLIPVNT
jgi:hypothetical protein